MHAGLALLTAALWLRLGLAARGREPPSIALPDQGTVMGREVTLVRNLKAVVYLKIKYAKMPEQFGPPDMDDLPPLDDPADPNGPPEWPPACLQDKSDLERTHAIFKGLQRFDQLKFDKDCLYLNIFTPDGNAPAEGWPVMVWIHPGEFISGAISLWDGTILAAKQKVIVVTIAYRLNMYGFWTEGDGEYPGNYGLLDQVAALHWIKNRIHHFKGSPDDICLFGYDAGAISIGLHLMNDLTVGLFNRAIAMSGNALVPGAVKTIKTYEEYKQQVIKKTNGICNADGLSACLRLLKSLDSVTYGTWGPVANMYFNGIMNMPKTHVYVLGDIRDMKDMSFRKVDFMTGYTEMEDALTVLGDMGSGKSVSEQMFQNAVYNIVEGDVMEAMPMDNDTCPPNVEALHEAALFYYSPQPLPEGDMLHRKLISLATERKYGSSTYKQAMEISKKGAKVYVYRFDYKIKTPLRSNVSMEAWITVPHMYDLPFVWGMPYWQTVPQLTWNNADRKHTDTVMTLWTNFARFSNPAQAGITQKWDMFNDTSPRVMLIDRILNMSDYSKIDYKAFVFWNDYYPKVKEKEIGCCNTTATGTVIHYEPLTMAVWAFLVGSNHVMLH